MLYWAIKDVMNCIPTFTGATNNLWLLCLMYVVYILNITANSIIGDISSHQHCIIKHLMFLLHFVSDSLSQSTTLIMNLFLPPVRKRGDGLVLPLMSWIFSPFIYYLRMIPIRFSIALLFNLLLLLMNRSLILNSLRGG